MSAEMINIDSNSSDGDDNVVLSKLLRCPLRFAIVSSPSASISDVPLTSKEPITKA